MLLLRISSNTAQTERVLTLLQADASVSALSRGPRRLPSSAGRPWSWQTWPVSARTRSSTGSATWASTWVGPCTSSPSAAGCRRPGTRRNGGHPVAAPTVVWAEVTQRAYEDSELNWTYSSFMTLATLIATIAIVLDSQILVIGAMVLGPEFGAVVALGVALVRRRFTLLRRAAVTLVARFGIAIALTTCSGC